MPVRPPPSHLPPCLMPRRPSRAALAVRASIRTCRMSLRKLSVTRQHIHQHEACPSARGMSTFGNFIVPRALLAPILRFQASLGPTSRLGGTLTGQTQYDGGGMVFKRGTTAPTRKNPCVQPKATPGRLGPTTQNPYVHHA